MKTIKLSTLAAAFFAAQSAVAQLGAPGPSQTGGAANSNALDGNQMGQTASSHFDFWLMILDWIIVLVIAGIFAYTLYQYTSKKHDSDQAWVKLLVAAVIGAIYYTWRM